MEIIQSNLITTHRDQIVDAFGNYKAQSILIERSAINSMGRLMLDAMATSFAPLVNLVSMLEIMHSSLFQVRSSSLIKNRDGESN